jgi:hypothetical protein
MQKYFEASVSDMDKHVGAMQVQVDRIDNKLQNYRRDSAQAQETANKHF